VLNNAIVVQGDFNIATNVDTANPLSQNFTLNGTIDLGAGTPRTITGLTAQGNVQLGGVISNGDLNLVAGPGVPGASYTMFTFDGAAANTYGSTTVQSNVVLNLNSAAANSATTGAVPGNLDVEGNGVVMAQQNNQIGTGATVTVNSTGNTINGVQIAGFDLAGTQQTITTLTGSGTVALGSGLLTITGPGTFNGVISDGSFGTGGNLTIDAASDVVGLGGANTYTGVTTLTAGTLQAEVPNAFSSNSIFSLATNSVLDLNSIDQTIAALAGSGGTVSLGSATLTNGGENFDSTFAGVIQGTGGITKVGTGMLSLSGPNTYTGPTIVNGGSLDISGSGVSPITMNNGTTLFVESTGSVSTGAAQTAVTLTQASTLDSAGSITGTGAGSIAVTMGPGRSDVLTNETSGTITGETGILVDNTSGLSTIVNDGTITGTGGIAIDARTSAGVTITNLGTINGQILLGGSGGTVVLATGEPLPPSLDGGGTGTLRLAGGSEGTLNLNTVQNFFLLDKVGGGFWTLTGMGTFPGGTNISAGTLNLIGTLNSNVTIQGAGTLTGTGVVNGYVYNQGTVMPGIGQGIVVTDTSVGALKINGDFTQAGHGQLVIQVAGHRPGEYDVLNVSGHVNLGGLLLLEQTTNKGPTLGLGKKLTIISAGGGITGQFGQVINDLQSDTIVVPTVIYQSNAVVIEGVQGSFLELSQHMKFSTNETAVASALDRVAGDKGLAPMFVFLDSRRLEQLPEQLDKIAPTDVGSVFRLGVSLSDVQSNNIQRRTSDIRAGTSGFTAAGFQTGGNGPGYAGGLQGPDGNDGKVQAAPDRRWGTFITGVGDFLHVGSTDNARGYNLTTGGMTVGADYKVNDNLAVGVNAGYVGTDSPLTGDGRLRVNGGRAGVYGTYWDHGFYGDVAASAGYNNYDIRRAGLQGDTRGSTQGAEADVLVDAGYDYRMDALTIGPTASFEYTYLGMDGFSESGSLAPLRYANQHQNSERLTLGVRASYDWKIGNVLVRPEAQIAWQREFGPRQDTIDASFESSAAGPFSITDTRIGADSLLLGGGVAVLFNPRTSTYIYYDAALLRKEYSSQSVTGGFKLNF
jgi:autotransporter-associated beta strand protein